MLNNRLAVASGMLLLALGGFADQNEIAKYDPNMAQKHAVIDTNGVKWIDGRYLPIEGRAFNDVEHYYDRLPAHVTTNVNAGVRSMKHHTAGMQFRFRTNSRMLRFEWTPYNSGLAMDHMPSTGVSGIDVYVQGSDGKWKYLKTGRIWDAKKGGSLQIAWMAGNACLVNLPLYNGIRTFRLGIDKNATVEALGPRTSGIDKPVVFYGTSITHGGCCSRPGLAFVNIVGRELDVPVVNLGFSGSGVMEYEMSEHLAKIDASCYVLDCLWNMQLKENPARPGRSVEGNYEKFIRNLHAKRPDVPIVMAEQCDVFCAGPTAKDRFVYDLCLKLKAEDPSGFASLFGDEKAKWDNLYYLPKDEMYVGDREGTVDGCHPNDWGMMSMAKAFGKAVKEALGM